MNRPKTRWLALSALLITAATGSALFIAQRFPRKITVDYPLEGSVFPPEFPPPTFLFRDASKRAAVWKIDVAFEGGGPALHASSRGVPFAFGPIDPRCVSSTNEPPRPTPEQAAAHTWMPDAETWTAIKRHSRIARPMDGYPRSGAQSSGKTPCLRTGPTPASKVATFLAPCN